MSFRGMRITDQGLRHYLDIAGPEDRAIIQSVLKLLDWIEREGGSRTT